MPLKFLDQKTWRLLGIQTARYPKDTFAYLFLSGLSKLRPLCTSIPPSQLKKAGSQNSNKTRSLIPRLLCHAQAEQDPDMSLAQHCMAPRPRQTANAGRNAIYSETLQL